MALMHDGEGARNVGAGLATPLGGPRAAPGTQSEQAILVWWLFTSPSCCGEPVIARWARRYGFPAWLLKKLGRR